MLRSTGSNKNLKRKKTSKQNSNSMSNKPKYEEDFNEIILNDLVPNEEKAEFNLQEKTSSKGKGLKLNLGLNKKKSPKKSSKKSVQNADKDTDDNDVVKKVENKNPEGKNTVGKKHKKSSTKVPVEEEQFDEDTTTSSKSKKSKGKVDKKSTKKSSKKSDKPSTHTTKIKKKKVKSSSKKEDMPERNEEVEETPLEEANLDYIDTEETTDSDSSTFRGGSDIEEINELKENDILEISNEKEKKFEHIVWSEEKFPKK